MNGHRPEVDSTPGANGHPTRLALPAAHHEQVRHLAQAVLANFIVDLLVAQIRFDPKPLFSQQLRNGFGIFRLSRDR